MDEPDGSENFWAVERIRSEGGILPFVEFSRMALYDPENGYYCRDRKRVGADRAADFQTNLSVRSTFAPLVLESLAYLLDGRDLGDFRFVEVGAEPESALFCGSEEHRFKDVEVVRIGDPVPRLAGPTVLFANEWLDAQPFVRLIFQKGSWWEVFVEVTGDGSLVEVLRPPASAGAIALQSSLPESAPEGYRFDCSAEVEPVLRPYLSGDWPGLFLTIDYGSSWQSLTECLPGGTARGYYRHRLVENLLARPGCQDLTCNVCWDQVSEVLRAAGFSVGGPQRQEAFFLEKGQRAVRGIVEGGESLAASGSRARLMQLLNPVHFGAAFQVLWGIR